MTNEALIEMLKSKGIEATPIVEDKSKSGSSFEPIRGKYRTNLADTCGDYKGLEHKMGEAPWGGVQDKYNLHLVIQETLEGEEAAGRHLFKEYNNLKYQSEERIDPDNCTNQQGEKIPAPVTRFISDLLGLGIGTDIDVTAGMSQYEIADAMIASYSFESDTKDIYVSAWPWKKNSGKVVQSMKFIKKPLVEYEQDDPSDIEL